MLCTLTFYGLIYQFYLAALFLISQIPWVGPLLVLPVRAILWLLGTPFTVQSTFGYFQLQTQLPLELLFGLFGVRWIPECFTTNYLRRRAELPQVPQMSDLVRVRCLQAIQVP